jgi:hypothetical protein
MRAAGCNGRHETIPNYKFDISNIVSVRNISRGLLEYLIDKW